MLQEEQGKARQLLREGAAALTARATDVVRAYAARNRRMSTRVAALWAGVEVSGLEGASRYTCVRVCACVLVIVFAPGTREDSSLLPSSIPCVCSSVATPVCCCSSCWYCCFYGRCCFLRYCCCRCNVNLWI